MTTPSSTAAPAAADRPGLRGRPLAGAAEWLAAEWHWLLIAAAYAVAWIPAFRLCWKENWSPFLHSDYILACAPYLPLGVGLVIWSWRERLRMVYAKAQPQRARDVWHRGNALLLFAGVALLFFSYLVQVKGFEVLSLVVIAAGVVYQVYGLAVLRALAAPLAYLILMAPPPDTAVTAIKFRFLAAGVGVLGQLFRAVHIPNTTFGWALRLDNTSTMVEFSQQSSPLCVAVPVVIGLLAYVMARRTRPAAALVILAFGGLVGLLVALARLALTALLTNPQPALAKAVNESWPLPWVLLAFGLTLLGVYASGRLGSRLPAPVRKAAVGVGRGVNVLLTPFMALFNGLSRVSVLMKRSEKATEKMLSKLSPRRKRRSRW